MDTHRRQIDQKEGEYSVLDGKLQARDALVKKCSDEKVGTVQRFRVTTLSVFCHLLHVVYKGLYTRLIYIQYLIPVLFSAIFVSNCFLFSLKPQ